jgi:hypothetical protein
MIWQLVNPTLDHPKAARSSITKDSGQIMAPHPAAPAPMLMTDRHVLHFAYAIGAGRGNRFCFALYEPQVAFQSLP